jgi:hypothetical protein
LFDRLAAFAHPTMHDVALIPCDSAMAAIDAPGAPHARTTSAFNSSL